MNIWFKTNEYLFYANIYKGYAVYKNAWKQ